MRDGILVIIIVILQIVSPLAQAACSSPSGVAQQLQWISGDSKVKFCDGTSWVDTTVTTGASCAGSTAGTINYASGDLRFCNGTNWISMKGTSLGSCSGSGAGTYNYDSGAYRFCDGTNWYKMKGTAAIVVDSSTVARVTGYPTDNVDITSASFTPPNNSMLVVAVNGFTWNNSVSDIDVAVSDSGSGSWVKIGEQDPQAANVTGYQGHASLFYRMVSTGSAMTVKVRRTLSSTGNPDLLTFKTYIVTGQDPYNPIGQVAIGSEQTTNNTNSTYYMSSQNGSRGIMSASEANNLGLPSSTDDEDAYHAASALSGMSVLKASNTATAGTAVTFNLDAGGTSAPKWNYVAAEILPEDSWPTVGSFKIFGPVRVKGAPADNVDLTTASFIPKANSLLIATINADTGPSTSPSFSVSSSNGVTWTMATKADFSTTGSAGHASVWWAKVPTGGSPITVSARRTSSSGAGSSFNLAVYVVTGHDTTTPIGASNRGTSTSNNLTAAAFNSTVNNSVTFGTATDWEALGLPSSTDRYAPEHMPGAVSMVSVYKTSPTATSGSAVTLNFDAAGTANATWNWVALEVRPAP